MTSPRGLEVVVCSDETRLVVTSDCAEARRALGPLAWCALEALALHARLDGESRLVASSNARDLARLLGVGRDAATRSLATLRRSGFIATEERRGAGGRFARTELVIALPVQGDIDTPAVGRRRAPRTSATLTLFDPPAPKPDTTPNRKQHSDTTDNTREEEHHPDTTAQERDDNTDPDTSHRRLPENSHTLALGMPARDPGGARC